jgi:transcriptional regulator with XRE-family HTH domain
VSLVCGAMTQPTPWTYLSRARERAGYNKSELARAVDASPSHLCEVEAGKRGLSPRLRCRVAEVLGVDVDRLIDTAPTPPPQVPARRSAPSGTEAVRSG